MNDVISLSTRKTRVAESIIDIAEEILIRARNGEFDSIAIAVVYKDLHSGAFASMTDHAATQIGSCYEMIHELTNSKHEGTITEPPYPEENNNDVSASNIIPLFVSRTPTL